jgi:hypothetical protein
MSASLALLYLNNTAQITSETHLINMVGEGRLEPENLTFEEYLCPVLSTWIQVNMDFLSLQLFFAAEPSHASED